MKTDPHGPADTTMMGIVHDALRRDLARTRQALTTPPYPDGQRRAAIAGHVRWMMRFLHGHHEGEDIGLWPLVRRRSPDAATVLDVMDADHARIAPAIEAVTAAARGYATDDTDAARTGLLAALEDLCAVLLPHLQREEDQAMPVVAASISAADWRAWDQRFNIKTKSFAQLGDEGHWLLDGLDPARYQVVIHQVPAISRFILLYGFARRYRRRATARWGTSTHHRPAPPSRTGDRGDRLPIAG